MREKQICTEIKQSLEAEGCYAFKIPDMPAGSWDAQGDGAPSRMRFNPPKAFDLIAVRRGKAIAIEVKLLQSPNAIPITALRKSEANHLTAFYAAGGAAFVAIAYAFKPSANQAYVLGSKRIRELWFVSWPDWLALVSDAQAAGCKSIKRDDIMGFGLGVPWVGKGRWDFRSQLCRIDQDTWREPT